MAALSAGDLDGSSLQREAAEFGLSALEENPELMSRTFMMATKLAATDHDEAVAAELPTDFSLASLRARIAAQN